MTIELSDRTQLRISRPGQTIEMHTYDAASGLYRLCSRGTLDEFLAAVKDEQAIRHLASRGLQ